MKVPFLLALGVFAAAASGCEKPGICGGKELSLEISGNHGHTEHIEKGALEKGAGRFVVEGGSHEHGFRLTDADLAKLRAGEALSLRSTSMNAHVHEIRVKCVR